MSDTNCAHQPKEVVLHNGEVVRVNDHVYLTPEQPGEPSYIGRVMEFCPSSKKKGLYVRIAWYMRAKDVMSNKSTDPRLLVATMHSDVNPVSSIRGKCTVTHKNDIPKDQIVQYKKGENNFYYNQLYDRYIQRVYDVVPCESLQNLPMDILKALKERFQYIIVDQGKVPDLTVARRICCVCQEWCSSNVSVKCSGCQKNYHMSCLNPPLVRKPSKGFAWQCAFCTKQEVEAESQSSDSTGHASPSPSVDSQNTPDGPPSKRQTRSSRSMTTQPSPTTVSPKQKTSETSIKLKISNPVKKSAKRGTSPKMTNMWPFRYFCINTTLDDILDPYDRTNPRAKTRIGVKHQAEVMDLDEFARNSDELRREYLHRQTDKYFTGIDSISESNKSSSYVSPLPQAKTSSKLLHEENTRSYSISSLRSSCAPSLDEPSTSSPFSNVSSAARLRPTRAQNSNICRPELLPVRGTDETITYIYRNNMIPTNEVDAYMEKVKKLRDLPLPSHSSDLLDKALIELENSDYNTQVALSKMKALTDADFNYLSTWTQEETDAFEQSIREHGHELNFVKKVVPTKTMAEIVRFFYQWKKTERYEAIYSEWTKIYRPAKKFKSYPRTFENEDESMPDVPIEEDQSSEVEDPNIVILPSNAYQCAHCHIKESDIWRRHPSDIDPKKKILEKVLCDSCGTYWLKYAKLPPTSYKNKAIDNYSHKSSQQEEHTKISRKRSSDTTLVRASKKYKDNKNEVPLIQDYSCKVCVHTEPKNRLYSCTKCGLVVHNDCYGVKQNTDKNGWLCDPCHNKVNPAASYIYQCTICCQAPDIKQQPLKKTSGYVWAHVQCATFIPEIKYVDPETLSPVEYIGCVNPARFRVTCRLCNNPEGICVACSTCEMPVHVQCAIDSQFKLAFELQTDEDKNIPKIPGGVFPGQPKPSLMIPQVWCPGHEVNDLCLIDLHTRTLDTNESSLMTYTKKYKRVSPNTTPAMRRFRSTRFHPYLTQKPKEIPVFPKPKEAVLQAINMRENLMNEQQNDLFNVRSTKVSKGKSTIKPRSCGTAGCPVKYSPIWWDADKKQKTSKKICQRCHQKSNE
ncbi:BAH domain-containing protein [Pilobolus umbonatus]|nr:BAH domain-containing protein [Pilobolus umbonatus]